MDLGPAFILIALLAYANGSNDVSKSVATLVGGGVTDCRRALRWGAVWTMLGALLGGLFAASLAERFARSLGASAGHDAAIPLAVGIASFGWVAFSSRTGLPVSTTHAMTGAILGAGWMATGTSPWTRADVLTGLFIPLFVSPLMAVGLTFLLAPLMTRAGRWLEARCVCVVPAARPVELLHGGTVVRPMLGVVMERIEECEGRSTWSWYGPAGLLDQAHWMSSVLVSMSRGMNDAPKIWALLVPLVMFKEADGRFFLPAAIVLVAVAMGLGSWLAGHRVTEVLAQRVTRMDRHEGFAANLATAILVLGASRMGLPVSTTHVSSGAIIGAGLGQGRQGIRWRVLAEMATAWVLTLPVAALLAMACYRILM